MKTCEENFRAHLRKEKRSKYCPNDPAHLYLKTFIFNIRLRDVNPRQLSDYPRKDRVMFPQQKQFLSSFHVYTFSRQVFTVFIKKLVPFGF